jgi:hypothetical protein
MGIDQVWRWTLPEDKSYQDSTLANSMMVLMTLLPPKLRKGIAMGVVGSDVALGNGGYYSHRSSSERVVLWRSTYCQTKISYFCLEFYCLVTLLIFGDITMPLGARWAWRFYCLRTLEWFKNVKRLMASVSSGSRGQISNFVHWVAYNQHFSHKL